MNILIVGGGSKFGLSFTKFLKSKDHSVDIITSKMLPILGVDSYRVNWNTVKQKDIIDIANKINNKNKIYDIIFFNQNSYMGIDQI
jgi:dTDP-4-dehydrorhamnose reductase